MLLYRISELERLLKQWHDDDCKAHDELVRRVSTIENGAAVRETRLAAVESETKEHDASIDRLNTTVTWWNGGNSIAAIIAGIIGSLK